MNFKKYSLNDSLVVIEKISPEKSTIEEVALSIRDAGTHVWYRGNGLMDFFKPMEHVRSMSPPNDHLLREYKVVVGCVLDRALHLYQYNHIFKTWKLVERNAGSLEWTSEMRVIGLRFDPNQFLRQ